MKIYSGKSCFCDIGININQKDSFGKDLHTGDIVLVWYGRWIGTDYEEWALCGGLTAVVTKQYQSYTDGTTVKLDEESIPFVMGIKDLGFNHPEWRIQLVKKFSSVVQGENWVEYGFSYK